MPTTGLTRCDGYALPTGSREPLVLDDFIEGRRRCEREKWQQEEP